MPITFADRLLAEAVRVHEQGGSAPIEHDGAQAAARAAGGDFEARVVRRARALPEAKALDDALHQVRRAALLAVFVGTVLAVAGGAGAARAALAVAPGHAVNFFLLLIGLLGLQTLLLLGWLIMIGARPHALAAGSLGGLVLAVGQRLARRLHRGPHAVSAARAIGAVMARGTLGRWTLSAVSHWLWLVFNVAALVVVVILLSARSYTFTWETTILSERTYVPLTEAIAFLPRLAGFTVPDAAQIAASRAGDRGPAAGDPSASEAWSGLLVGALVVYGVGPRLLLLGLALSLRRIAARRYRLDLSRPGFARLRPGLVPETRSLGVVDADDAGAAPSDAAPPVHGEPGTGPPVVVGFEIDSPESGWPPARRDVHWNDLGIVDDRGGQQRAVAGLAGAAPRPSAVVVVADLTATPDRGMQRFLRELAAAGGCAPRVALTAGNRLRERSGRAAVDSRVKDWRRSAEAGGAESVVEIDLDHVTDVTRQALVAFAGAGPLAPSIAFGGRRLEQSLDLVRAHSAGWDASPSLQAQAELHRALAGLYDSVPSGFVSGIKVALGGGDVRTALDRLRDGAGRAIDLLPGRLKRSPRWLAAGAITGAVGCVAAAGLLSPIAISGLPVWSAIGAAIAGALQPAGSDEPVAAEAPDGPGFADAVRAATLLMLLLELQGRDEASISRVLDRVLPADDDPFESLDDTAAVDGFLAEIRHRFDLALAEEARA